MKKTHLDINQLVGRKVREYRMNLGLSQEALAEKCGLHRTYIGGVERGERNITLKTLIKISRSLKVLPTKLLS